MAADTDAGAGCVFFGSSLINNDVWFKYTATQNADITVATCGLTTLDTKMAIFLNSGDTDAIACNDDDLACTNFTSTLEFNGTAGEEVVIAVGGYSATDSGPGILTIIQGSTAIPCGDPTAGDWVI